MKDAEISALMSTLRSILMEYNNGRAYRINRITLPDRLKDYLVPILQADEQHITGLKILLDATLEELSDTQKELSDTEDYLDAANTRIQELGVRPNA